MDQLCKSTLHCFYESSYARAEKPESEIQFWVFAQQTRNHFWTTWHVSYWFLIGTAPPVHVFMCIHGNTRVLPVVTSFERVRYESYWVRTGTVSLAHVIKWKTRVDTLNVFTESGEFTWIEPVELMNSLTEHVKWQVVVCWVCLHFVSQYSYNHIIIIKVDTYKLDQYNHICMCCLMILLQLWHCGIHKIQLWMEHIIWFAA